MDNLGLLKTIWKGMKVILRRNFIQGDNKEQVFFIYNHNYKFLSLIKESDLHFQEDEIIIISMTLLPV